MYSKDPKGIEPIKYRISIGNRIVDYLLTVQKWMANFRTGNQRHVSKSNLSEVELFIHCFIFDFVTLGPFEHMFSERYPFGDSLIFKIESI